MADGVSSSAQQPGEPPDSTAAPASQSPPASSSAVAPPADAPDPSDLPAPVGTPDHPGVTTKNGFYFFRDEYQLPKEPGVDDAETRYLAEVEKAFQNRWPLHPNLVHHRNDAEKIRHAYDLDFRETEIKRIRDILPVDKPVFDYIDALVDVVMLKNLEIYVQKRFAAFRHVTRDTQRHFRNVGAFVFAFACIGFGILFSAWHWFSLIGLELAALPAIAIAGLATLRENRNQIWPNISQIELTGPKEKYEEAVRDAAGLAASKLATKGRDVENLMNALKNRLDTMLSPDESRVEHAPKLVRILLWNPERMGLIENYYRAKMDQFMVKSARVSIANAVNIDGLITNRSIFLKVLWRFFAASVVIGGLVLLAGLYPHQPWSISQYFAATLLTVLLLAIAITVTLARYAVRLVQLGHKYEPAEVAKHTVELQRNGLRAAVAGIALGLLPLVAVIVYPPSFIPVLLLALAAFITASIWFWVPIIFARRIYREYEKEYSSNVLEAVQKKMDASLWTRYSDLRIDQRLAEVFTAIYQAWYKADSKGVFGSPP